MAALPMLYGAPLPAMPFVATDEMNTTCPPPFLRISGMNARHSWCGPRACVSTRFHSSFSSVSTMLRPREALPPFTIAMSRPPWAAWISSIILRQSSGWSVDAWKIAALPPEATIAPIVSSAASLSRR